MRRPRFAVFDDKGAAVVVLELVDPEPDRHALWRLHVTAVFLQREFPQFLGRRAVTGCPSTAVNVIDLIRLTARAALATYRGES